MSKYSYERQLVAQEDLNGYKLESNPKIGIIMPFYNAYNTIHNSVDGILSQSYHNWKLFIIDDCSTDISVSYTSWLENLNAGQDSRISIARLDKNVGPSEARNLALKMISQEGIEYIALCDSDDVWISPDHLKENLKFLIATDGDLCYSDVECVFEDGSPAHLWVLNEGVNHYDDMDYNKLLEYNWIYTSTVVMKNLNLLFDKTFDGIEDWDYWLQVLENNHSIYHLNRLHARYLVKTTDRSQTNASVATWGVDLKREEMWKKHKKKKTAVGIIRDLL